MVRLGKSGMNEFIQSFLSALGNMDYTTIKPMTNYMFHPLFDKEWVARIEEVADRVEQQKIPLEKVAASISGPTHLRAQLFFLLLDLKTAKIPSERRLKIAGFFENVLKVIAKDDVYGRKSNIKHTKQEVQAIMTKPFAKGDEDKARVLGRLFTACYHLVNGLYTDFYTDYGTENFGAYDLGGNRSLVIKHFGDNRPSIWPVNTSCKSVTLYSVYENVKFTCDAVSCHSQYEGDPIAGLKQYLVEIDGKTVNDPEQLEKLSEEIAELSAEQWQRLVGLDRETLKQQGLLMRCYTFKDLFELVGMSWEPDEAMKEAVKGKPWAIFKMPKDNAKEYLAKVLDPALDFYG